MTDPLRLRLQGQSLAVAALLLQLGCATPGKLLADRAAPLRVEYDADRKVTSIVSAEIYPDIAGDSVRLYRGLTNLSVQIYGTCPGARTECASEGVLFGVHSITDRGAIGPTDRIELEVDSSAVTWPAKFKTSYTSSSLSESLSANVPIEKLRAVSSGKNVKARFGSVTVTFPPHEWAKVTEFASRFSSNEEAEDPAAVEGSVGTAREPAGSQRRAREPVGAETSSAESEPLREPMNDRNPARPSPDIEFTEDRFTKVRSCALKRTVDLRSRGRVTSREVEGALICVAGQCSVSVVFINDGWRYLEMRDGSVPALVDGEPRSLDFDRRNHTGSGYVSEWFSFKFRDRSVLRVSTLEIKVMNEEVDLGPLLSAFKRMANDPRCQDVLPPEDLPDGNDPATPDATP